MDWPLSSVGEAGEIVADSTGLTAIVTLTHVLAWGAPRLLSLTRTE
jgi:hypothetical protein